MSKKRFSESTMWALTRYKTTFSKREKYVILAALILSVALNFLEVLGILVFGLMGIVAIQGVSGIRGTESQYRVLSLLGIEDFSLQLQISILAVIAVTLLTARTLLSILFFQKFHFFLARKSAQTSKDFLFSILNSKLEVFEKYSVQTWFLAATKSVSALYTKVMSSAVSMFVDLSLIVIIMIGLLTYNFLTGFLTIVFFAFVALASSLVSSRRVNKLSEDDLMQETILGQDFRGLLEGFKEFDRNPRILTRVYEIGDRWLIQSKIAARMTMIPILSKYVFESAVLVGLLGFAGAAFLFFEATVAFGSISAFLIASARIVPSIARIQTNINILSSASASLLVLREIEEVLPLIKHNGNQEKGRDKESSNFDILISNVSYSRGKLSLVCDELKINAGEKIAIIGASGTGKTTLLDLLAGLREPNKGQIRIAGFNVADFRGQFENQVVYVPQEISLIRGNLRENLLLAADSSQDDEAIDWLGRFGLWERFQNQMGLEANVSRLHQELSGGEKQRLGLVRAILQNPRILLLDEFSSSLDEKNTEIVVQSLIDLNGVTVIASTHNKKVISQFEKVIEIKNGIVGTVSQKLF